MKRSFLILFSVLSMSGCTGTLYTIVNPTLPTVEETKIKGVLVYSTINVIELYKTMVLVDKSSGNQIGVAPEKCTPDNKIKFSTRTDYKKPNVIVYEPGYFETNKFGLTLNKGVLSGVNVESTPSAALSGIAALLPFVKAPKIEASSLVLSGKPLCNAGAKLIGVYQAPDIQAFDEIKQ
ncbi:MAG: hypothetical protein RPR97_16805 [Colwellia sp.]